MISKINDLLLSTNAKIVIRYNQVVATNQLYGNWVRFSKECFDYISQAMDLGMTKSIMDYRN